MKFFELYSERYINRLIVAGINEQEERATGRAGKAAAGDFQNQIAQGQPDFRDSRAKAWGIKDARQVPGRKDKDLQDSRKTKKKIVGKGRRHSYCRAVGIFRRGQGGYTLQVHSNPDGFLEEQRLLEKAGRFGRVLKLIL